MISLRSSLFSFLVCYHLLIAGKKTNIPEVFVTRTVPFTNKRTTLWSQRTISNLNCTSQHHPYDQTFATYRENTNLILCFWRWNLATSAVVNWEPCDARWRPLKCNALDVPVKSLRLWVSLYVNFLKPILKNAINEQTEAAENSQLLAGVLDEFF